MAQITHTHRGFHPHHVYQLETIFLCFVGYILFFGYYLFMRDAGLDMTTYQWYFTISWLGIYTISCLWLRSHVPPGEIVAPLKRPIIHWVLLGIVLIASQSIAPPLTHLYSFDIVFLVCTLFVADAYWDFI